MTVYTANRYCQKFYEKYENRDRLTITGDDYGGREG